MAETNETEVETLTLGEFAKRRGIDSALLRLLADGGHVETVSKRRGTHRFSAASHLTVEEAEQKGRVAYNGILETVGRLVMKTQSRMRRLLEEIEEQQEYLNDILPLGPGLSGLAEGLLGSDKQERDMLIAVGQLISWNRVLGNLDEIRRLHASFDADAEMGAHTTLPLEDQWEISGRPARTRRRPTPLADELPDGVDELSPEARRTVLDLLRVLVAAETGSGPR